MKDKLSISKRSKVVLILALVTIMVCSILANMINTNFWTVKVTEIEMETPNGILSAYLYMPKDMAEGEQRPVVITTHGYYNSKENQESNAIEMARRGFIVVCMEMYDHGDSQWGSPTEYGDWTNWYNPFWRYSIFDAVSWVYDQPYTLKDADGNGYISVSGHSMGGFASQLGTYDDEINSLTVGYRMIHALLPVGADYTYSGWFIPQDQLEAAFGDRPVGMIAAQYDEFFFNKSNTEKTAEELAWAGTVLDANYIGTVSKKSYVDTASGQQFLGGNSSVDTWYTVASGDLLDADGNVLRESQDGQHIIHQPASTHAWCYFSTTSVGHAIDFYREAFSEVLPAKAALPASNQIWWIKEVFTTISLIAFFLLFAPLLDILLQLPGLKHAKTGETAPIGKAGSKKSEVFFWSFVAVLSVIITLTYTTIADRYGALMPYIQWTFGGIGILGVLGIVVFGFIKKNKDLLRCSIGCGILGGVAFWLLKNALVYVQLGKVFKQPQTGLVAYWSLIIALMVGITLILFYYLAKKRAGAKFEDYGIVLQWKPIAASVGISLIMIAFSMAILFIVDALFKVDFRFWALVNVKPFGWRAAQQVLVYLPFFLAYFLVCAINMKANVIGRKNETAAALVVNLSGMALFLILQYGFDFLFGKATFTGAALNTGIMLSLIGGIAIATVLTVKLFKKTNNIWVPAVFNAILFTILSCSNTATFWTYAA